MTETSLAAAPAPAFKLAKTLGILAITASAVSAEYGSGINYVSVQSLSVYPDVKGLVPLAMFVCGIAMLPKAYLFAAFSRVMPRAGSKHVWLARSVGLPAGFLITFTYWATGPAGLGFLGYRLRHLPRPSDAADQPGARPFPAVAHRASAVRAGGDLADLLDQRRRHPPLRDLRYDPDVRHRRSGAVDHRLRLPDPAGDLRGGRKPGSEGAASAADGGPASEPVPFHIGDLAVRLRLCRARCRSGARRRSAAGREKGTDRHHVGLVGRARPVHRGRRRAVPRRAVVGGRRSDQGRQDELCDGAGADRAGRAELADRRSEPAGRADRRQDAGARA